MAHEAPEIVEQPEQITMVVRAVVPMAEIADVFHRAFPALGAVAADQQSQLQSPAFALYHGAPGDTADLEVGFVTGAAVEPVGDVVVGFLPGGRIARTVYAGGYEGLGEAWAALFGWATSNDLEPSGEMWEVYLNMPTPDGDPADNRTELNLQLR